VTENDQIQPVRRRPALVWVISAFYFIVPLLGSVISVAMYVGVFPVPVRSSDSYFASYGRISLAIGLIQSGTDMAGASLLWLLRRQAFHCFIASTILSIFTFWWEVLIRGWVGAIHRISPGMTVPIVIGAVTGSGLMLATAVYTWRLTKKGVLN
jgi:hypothetical protein